MGLARGCWRVGGGYDFILGWGEVRLRVRGTCRKKAIRLKPKHSVNLFKRVARPKTNIS